MVKKKPVHSYLLSTPIPAGSWPNQVSVPELFMGALSFNLQRDNIKAGKAIVAVILESADGSVQFPFMYEGAQALAFFKTIDKENFSVVSLTKKILKHLQSVPDSEGKKLPPGKIKA